MPDGFRLLKIFSIAFKVIAWLAVFFMAIGIVGLLVGAKAKDLPFGKGPVILNMAVSSVLFFLIFYTAGEVIRILLRIEEHTRKPPTLPG